MKDKHTVRRATPGQERTPLPSTIMRNLDWWGKLHWVFIGVALECFYLLVCVLAPIATVYPQNSGVGGPGRPQGSPLPYTMVFPSNWWWNRIWVGNGNYPDLYYLLLGITFVGLGCVYLYAVIRASRMGAKENRMPTRGIPTFEQAPTLSPHQPLPRWGKGGRVSRDVVTPLVGVRVGLQKVLGGGQRNLDAINRVPTAWLLLPLIGAAVFGITLLFVPALFSSDIFMYISASHMPNMYYGPSFSSLVGPFPPIPNYGGVFAHFRPVLYGPLWLGIAGAINQISTGVGSDLATSVLLFRGLALLVHLINCVLVWAILSKRARATARVAPTLDKDANPRLGEDLRLSGTLLYAWNPLVLIELVVNGHNDGVAICLLLLAVWFYVQQRGGWFEIVALLCCGLAIGVNLMALLIMPLLLWFMVRDERHIARALLGFCWRGLLVLAVVCIVYAPVWQGGVTFLAIISSIDIQDYGYSFLALLVMPLSALFTQLTAGINLPSSVLQPVAAADTMILASTIFIFTLLYFQAMGRVRKDTTGCDQLRPYDVLFTSWTVVILGFVVLAATLFWPWYIVWVVWIVALRRFDTLTIAVLLLSCTALLYYPLLHLDRTPAGIYVFLCVFGAPLVYLIARRSLPRKRVFRSRISGGNKAKVVQRPVRSS